MIQINSNIPTKIAVDMNVSGVSTKPKLRFLIFTPEFFIGFEGTSSEISIPELNQISWKNTIVEAKIEAILDEFYLTIWEDSIKLEDVVKGGLKENLISIKVDFVDTPEPETSIKAILKK